jgi:DnaK suppressor protein
MLYFLNGFHYSDRLHVIDEKSKPDMPDKLTRFQIEQFKNLLHNRFSMVRSDLYNEFLSIDQETDEQIGESIYEAAAEVLADLLTGLKAVDYRRYVDELKDIEEALLRIAKGEYGMCADCGRSINFKRLLAYPTAKRCLACQRL